MKRSWMFSAVTLALLVGSFSTAEAGPITAGVMSTKPVADNSGTPFYHGASWDCPLAICNAGALVPDGLRYLHDGSGGAAAFGFSLSAHEWWLAVEDMAGACGLDTDCDFNDAVFRFIAGEFHFIAENTFYRTNNTLGWADLDSPAMGVIFTGDQGPGAVVLVPLPLRFSFWYQRDDNIPLRFDSLSDRQQFALFGPAAETVPEPATWLLLGTGLACAAYRMRRTIHSRRTP